jgi:hypothetical protein
MPPRFSRRCDFRQSRAGGVEHDVEVHAEARKVGAAVVDDVVSAQALHERHVVGAAADGNGHACNVDARRARRRLTQRNESQRPFAQLEVDWVEACRLDARARLAGSRNRLGGRHDAKHVGRVVATAANGAHGSNGLQHGPARPHRARTRYATMSESRSKEAI